MRKLISILMCVSIMINAGAVFAEETHSNKAYDTAFASFNLVGNSGFTSVKLGSNDNKTSALRDGKEGFCIDKALPTAQRYLYFDFDDNFAHEVNDGSVFDIEIEYYSEENGFFAFEYDSVITEAVRGAAVETGNDKVWKTYKCTIDDAWFGGRLQNGADFLITTSYQGQDLSRVYSASSVIIGEVRVIKHTAKNPILLTADIEEAGNTFSWFEEKVIHNQLTNTLDEKVEISVRFSGVDTVGYSAVKEETVTIEPKQTISLDYSVETERCGLYTYNVDITDKEGKINSHFEPFEFVILKTDPNGIKNETYYINTHLNRAQSSITSESIVNAIDIIAKANVGGIREGFNCDKNMPTYGSFVHPEREAVMLEEIRKNDMKILAYLNPHNTLYGVADSSRPIFTYCDSDKTNGVQQWLSWLIPEIRDVVDVFELQNEPNARVYRGEISIEESGKNYTSWAKAMYPVIKEYDPEACFGVGSLAYAESQKTYDWVRELLKNGIADSCDGLAWHPYVHWTPYESGSSLNSANVYRDLWAEYSDKELLFFDTESGDTVADWSKPDHETVGDYLVRRFIYQKIHGIAEVHNTYVFDKKGPLPSDRENMFGIAGPHHPDTISHNSERFVPTVAFVEMAAMNYWLGNADYVKSIQPDGNTYITEFDSKKFNSNVYVMWVVNGFKTVTVETGAKELTYSDGYGNTVKMNSDNGKYTFTLTGQPIYIQGDINDIKVLEESEFYYENNEINTAAGDIAEIRVKSDAVSDGALIKAKSSEVVTVSPVSEFKDGEAKLDVKLKEGYIGKASVELIIEKDGKACSAYNMPVLIGDAVASALDKSIAPGNNYNRWKLNFNITNNYASRAMKGKISVTSPKEFASEIGTVDFGIIPRGKTASIAVNSPVVYEKKIYNIEYKLMLEDGQVYEFSQPVDFTLAAHTKEEITVDGKISGGEWNMDTAMIANTPDRVKLIPDWSGENDLSAKTMIQWDDEKLYLYSRVKDNIFSQNNTEPGQLWAGDSIQFGLYKEEKDAFIIAGQGVRILMK